jgi:hypothetical protein
MTGPDEMTAAEYLRLVGGRDPMAGRDRPATGTKGKRRTEPPAAFKRFAQYLELGGFGPVLREHRFHPSRRWRFDFFLPRQGSCGIAFEYDGIYGGPTGDESTVGHNSVAGIMRDSEKANEAQAMGIPVYRVNAGSINDGSAFELVARVLRKDG